MIVQDEGTLAVRCQECKKVSAVTVPWVKDYAGRVLSLARSQWPKACPDCGMISVMPTTPEDYQSQAVVNDADTALRASLITSRR